MSGLCVYIHRADIEAYRAQGWEVSVFLGHHGASYALACMEWPW